MTAKAEPTELTAGDLVARADGFRPWLLVERAASLERAY
jgi:hypothetical protein